MTPSKAVLAQYPLSVLVQVVLDGAVAAESSSGYSPIEVPLEPGDHRIEVRAAGREQLLDSRKPVPSTKLHRST